jgi:hypothetical protein
MIYMEEKNAKEEIKILKKLAQIGRASCRERV